MDTFEKLEQKRQRCFSDIKTSAKHTGVSEHIFLVSGLVHV
jgi:hypothetical protein